MSHPSAPGSPPSFERPPDDRLDSWKEIAAYLKRDVTTVQRWEKREGMPVHRHVHDKLGSVYAFRSDLDAWVCGRNLGSGDLVAGDSAHPSTTPLTPTTSRWTPGGRNPMALAGGLAAAGLLLAAVAVFWLRQSTD